jgi:hypothetical protein
MCATDEISVNPALPVIQCLWIGGALSLLEQLSLASFVKNGHAVHLYVYNRVSNVPAGVTIIDGREIIDEKRIFKYKNEGSYAGFSNVFRYKLLLDRGNYWCDLDVICLRPFDFDRDYVFSGAIKRMLLGVLGAQTFIQSCVIKCPTGSDIMRYCYETSTSKDPNSLAWGEIGPNLLQEAVQRFGHRGDVVPHGTFTTVDWMRAKRFVSGSPVVAVVERLKIARYRSYAVHLYNEVWRRNGLDKNGTFPNISIFEELKRRYL